MKATIRSVLSISGLIDFARLHLTMFDAYNIATEISSHTTETGSSSRHGLDKFANELVFDRTDRSQHAARFGGPSVASFSDADQAFFGDVDEDDSE